MYPELGIVAKIASRPAPDVPQEPDRDAPESATSRRFRLQRAAARLLPDEKVAQCLRFAAPVDPAFPDSGVHEDIEIHQDLNTGRCSTRNLILCDRVWLCPVCSSRISEQRREELELAYYYSGKHFLMATFTLRHNISEPLQNVLKRLSDAFRGMKSGRWWQDFKREFDWLGDIRALEITHGQHGWHPHMHALMVFDREISPHLVAVIEAQLKRRWLKALENVGADGTWSNACKVTGANSEIVDYITKFGRLPKDKDGSWQPPTELTKSQQKVGRAGGRSIWDILDEYEQTGHPYAGKLFWEYAAATKGKAQLWWSPGLKDLIDLDALMADYGDESLPETAVIATIARAGWRSLYWAGKRAECLTLFESGDIDRAMQLTTACYRRHKQWLVMRKRGT